MKINLTKLLMIKPPFFSLEKTTDASYLALRNDGTAEESPYGFEFDKNGWDKALLAIKKDNEKLAHLASENNETLMGQMRHKGKID